ncbi:TetR/AcrR family transcriptional regulator [Mucilaginibacter frigoritolerans]|uniref:TetR/AcrR family transcriptional regulator n=1 Tax=Mucilaginibacter frigoritolerans TaxID=652788 RepID=UPI00119DBFCA|nr:TetR/AcrR family transcriptional regulator [Mucilaginibacter frigoritolerans]
MAADNLNTRDFILQKVAPLFNKKGYAGTSLSDLTDATGLTKGGNSEVFDHLLPEL